MPGFQEGKSKKKLRNHIEYLSRQEDIVGGSSNSDK